MSPPTAERAAALTTGRPGDRRLAAWAAITLASFVSYVLGKALTGDVATVFAVGGVAACAWAWLLTRVLFDAGPHEARWPLVVAALTQVTGGIATLASEGEAVGQIADNSYALCGSAALLLTFVEPLRGLRGERSDQERWFRYAFLAVYALLVAVSILGLRPTDAAEAQRIDWIKAWSAFAGIWATAAAVWYRLRHPLPFAAGARRRAPPAGDPRIAERLIALLRDEQVYAEPDLRIADVAARLGEPEHKVSQCIAGLGFANFNRMINHHRIARAKALLVDGAEDQSILNIAFQCGFASVGPFNRAFKDEAGMTPRAYRASGRPQG